VQGLGPAVLHARGQCREAVSALGTVLGALCALLGRDGTRGEEVRA
jgi:hypothetical protein